MITNENIENFKPVQAVVVFKRHHDEFYLQTHDIEDHKLKEGKPFHREQLQELAIALNAKSFSGITLKGMLPNNVMYYQPSLSGAKFVWYIPRSKRHIKFKQTLKIKSGECFLPGLVFAVNDKTLHVFAIKGTGKPKASTPLFHAPFFNIMGGASVCMGTTAETNKKAFLEEEIDRWERRFFGSNFTHSPNTLAKGFNMHKLYRSLVSGKRFPEKCLARAEYKTLGDFIKHFTKGGRSEY
jgi:PRTRC genetic system protein B